MRYAMNMAAKINAVGKQLENTVHCFELSLELSGERISILEQQYTNKTFYWLQHLPADDVQFLFAN